VKTVFFVRHGESEANAAGIVAGSRLDAPLTQKGRDQAKEVAKVFEYLKIDTIISSPQKRAHETAQIIADNLSHDKSKIVTTPLFQERDLGSLTGHTREKFDKAMQASELPKDYETNEQLHARIVKAFEWLKKQEGTNLILVGHNGNGRMIRIVAEDMPHSHYHKLDRFENTGVYEFTLE
jgi:broad specificity phosphatase PhoE